MQLKHDIWKIFMVYLVIYFVSFESFANKHLPYFYLDIYFNKKFHSKLIYLNNIIQNNYFKYYIIFTIYLHYYFEITVLMLYFF